MTLEQEARDLLERAGVEDAQSMTAGALVEIAELISHARLGREIAEKRRIGATRETDGYSLMYYRLWRAEREFENGRLVDVMLITKFGERLGYVNTSGTSTLELLDLTRTLAIMTDIHRRLK